VSGLEVDRAEVFVVGPDVPRARWAADLPEQFATHTVLRLTTADGLVGLAGAASYTGHGYSTAVAETLRPLVRDLLGVSAHDRESTWDRMRERTIPIAPQAHSLIDIALWDVAARAVGLPLHRFLDAAAPATTIPAYASTPLLADVPAFIEFARQLAADGYPAIKFHGWCEPARDLALVRAVRAAFSGETPRFMLDVEQRYGRADALAMARELEQLGFAWFEAPLPDTDLAGYAELRRQVQIPILPPGNVIVDEDLVALAIGMGAWSRLRLDVTTCGGITPARRLAAQAAANGLRLEIQSWGYTLAQAANLHFMLAAGTCSYFEQAVPVEPYEHATLTPIRIDGAGLVHAPAGPGLGVEVDWPALERAAILRYEVRR
jgi:L-alanine-DL-glutamate epimerase-like enolase superfamily enzyme